MQDEMTAYFDNAATTFPKPENVYSFMDSFYRKYGVNVGRGQHKLAAIAGATVTETRELLLSLNHCLNRKVTFTSSATEALNVILRSNINRKNMNIYITPFEHNAVNRVLHYLKGIYDLKIQTLSFDLNTCFYDLQKIEYQFDKNPPDVVIMSHASNVCGVLAPIEQICMLAKHYGALTIIDMSQTMGLVDTNLNNDNIDFSVFAAHKTLYGALGLGGFISKPNALLQPLLYGGTGIDSANLSMPETIPEKIEAGSCNILSIAALNAALKWIQSVGIEHIYLKEKSNQNTLLSLLNKFNNIKQVLPKTENCIGVVSCIFDGYSSDNIGQILSNHNVAVRTGLHCAPTAHRFLNTFPSGTVRFSVGYFNDSDDFALLEKCLKYIYDNI